MLVVALPHWRDDWRPVIWALAVLTLVVGAISAVVQTNVKRMLAYSSINHAGFILVGVEAAAHHAGEADGRGHPGVAVTCCSTPCSSPARSRVVTLVARTGDGRHRPRRVPRPGQAPARARAALTVFLLAQAGVPLTSGFIAKFGVIQAAVDEGSYALAIIAMVAVRDRRVPVPADHGQRVDRRRRRDDDAEPVRVPFRPGSPSPRGRSRWSSASSPAG